jgi:hypothetical protein
MKKQLKNIKNGVRVPAQHGEVFLQRIDKAPEGRPTEKHKAFTVGHSETGHHHVLESATEFEVMPGDEKHDLYLRLFEPAKLVHKKTFDIHETETIVPGDYAVYQKTEYDPFRDVVRAVFD